MGSIRWIFFTLLAAPDRGFKERESVRNAKWQCVRSFPAQIFLIALVLRLIPVILARRLSIGLDDMFQYDMLARSLASGNGFRWYAACGPGPYRPISASRPQPPRLLILAECLRPSVPRYIRGSCHWSIILNGINAGRFFAARLAQTLLGALLAPLTYYVAKSLSLPASVDGTRKRKRGNSGE